VIPVDQTQFRDDTGQRGNCFSACIASLLEIDLAGVPCFMQAETKWMNEANEWLAKHGYWYLYLPGDQMDYVRMPGVPDPWCIVAGVSPRDAELGHACVGRWHCHADWWTIKIVHDPHPSRLGLVGEHKGYGFLVPVDPARRLFL